VNIVNLSAAITKITNSSVNLVSDSAEIEDSFASHLHDESKTYGGPVTAIAFPKSIEELSSCVFDANQKNQNISVSSSRTGLTGGGVPSENSLLVSLEKHQGVTAVCYDESADRYFVKVKGGTPLSSLNSWLAENQKEHLTSSAPELYFPVDPTETSASVSGMIACNAAGARSFYYGATRPWVKGLSVVLSDGSILKCQRGQYVASDSSFVFNRDGSKTELSAASIPKPSTKNTLGYSFDKEIDLVDVIVGSEGTLGIICDVELWLAPVPAKRLFVLQFLDDEVKGLSLVHALRASDALECLAIEYCDKRCLDLVKDCPAAKESRAIQGIKDNYASAVFSEIIFNSDEHMLEVFEELETIVSSVGGSLDQSIAGSEPKDLRDIKMFRHAIPETINGIIAKRKLEHPKLHKIATDMAVPDEHLEEVFHLYKDSFSKAKLDFAVFGHAGNNHFHVNILPKDELELAKAKEVYLEIAKKVVELKGAVSAEHGVGRIKKQFLAVQYDSSVFENFKKIKLAFDPKGLLNKGVLIDL